MKCVDLNKIKEMATTKHFSQTFENKLAILNQIHYPLVSICKTQEEWLYYGKTKINVTNAGNQGLNRIMEWTQYHHF